MRHVRLASEPDLAGWRAAARALRLEGVAPEDTVWTVGGAPGGPTPPTGTSRFTVPREFLPLAAAVIRHGSPDRFSLLYRLLWRLGEAPGLLHARLDPDVARARAMAAEVEAAERNRTAATPLSQPTPATSPGPMSASASQPISVRAVRAALRASRDAPFDQGAPTSLEELAAGVDACRHCELWRDATQGVPGEGPARAALMLVGEQPGDQEDLSGRPFVGPAGVMLDKALAAAGVPRADAFVTNAVKHFKHELRGKRRLHKTPAAGEVEACRWWLDAERRLVRPRVIVALGATAALAVFGKTMPIAANRQKVLPLSDRAQGLVTYHPSFLLRVPDEEAKAQAYAAFVDDLRFAWSLVE